MVGVIKPIGIPECPREEACPLKSMVTEVIGGALALLEDNARDTGKDMKDPTISLKTKIGLPTDPVWRYPSLEHVEPHLVVEIR